MTDFMSIPSDVAIHIANQLDIKSFSQFLTTCTYVNKNTKTAFDNKVFDITENVFLEIIQNLVEYNESLLSVYKYQATYDICKSVFTNILNARSSDMDYLLTLLEQPVSKIVELIDVTEQDVHITLNQFVSEEDNNQEEEFQKQVVEALQECLFTKEYNVIFALLNNKNQEVKYRFILNINLSGSVPILKVIITDEENDTDLCDDAFVDNVNDFIDNAEITSDGEIVFATTEQNIKGLIRYICKVFGNGVFTHQLTNDGVQIQICNFMNQPFKVCEFYRNVVNQMTITQEASMKTKNYLNSVLSK